MRSDKAWSLKTYLYALLLFFSSASAGARPMAMVVSAQALASRAGMQVLRAGGNAVDAAVAIGYALAVVHPSSGNLAGGGFMLVRMHKTIRALDFREQAPRALTQAVYRHPGNTDLTQRYLSVGVPGTVAGLNLALARYGRLSLRAVMQPAIRLASQGFVLGRGDMGFFKEGYKSRAFRGAARSIMYLHGVPYRAGMRFRQPVLAANLRLIARQGDRAFYQGALARAMVRDSRRHGGVLSLKDLSDYRALVQKPIRCAFAGGTLWASPPPSQGGVVLCRILQQAARDRVMQHRRNSVYTYRHNLAAMHQAFRYAAHTVGDPNAPKPALKPPVKASVKLAPAKGHEGFNTTSYVVVDGAGNAVSVIYSLNDYFGSGLVAPGTGFFLNSQMKDFTFSPKVLVQLHGKSPNRLAPGKRPVSSMSPIMLTDRGRLRLVAGTPGGPTIPTQLALLLEDVFWYKLSLKEALAQPRYHMQWMPPTVYLEKNMPQHEVARFQSLPWPVKMGSMYGFDRWGGVTVIARSSRGRLSGAIDPRRPAGAVLRMRT